MVFHSTNLSIIVSVSWKIYQWSVNPDDKSSKSPSQFKGEENTKIVLDMLDYAVPNSQIICHPLQCHVAPLH